ncbi:heparinase II/III domain-containing protein [Bacteroides reticulotermitis]|nr:heparinase II/III family protein [Bacteroides reticulotermitis]
MTERSSNMSLSFRSSPFGSGSHTLADQNSFKLLYKGVYVYMNAGYYQNFSDKHNLLQYRHTRGHNTMLVNGIGQPYTTKAYGNVERGLNSENLAYFLGNASNAYCGISEYPLWLSAFEAAGITQTPVYGFGNTPLNNYKRHIFMLRPNIVVIYDDLGADEAVTWQWLLHSPVEFHIAGNKVTTTYPDKGGFTSVAQIFSEQAPTIETTNQWFPGGEPTVNPTVDKQWHLTANFGPSMRNKILTIIQYPSGR